MSECSRRSCTNEAQVGLVIRRGRPRREAIAMTLHFELSCAPQGVAVLCREHVLSDASSLIKTLTYEDEEVQQ